MKLIPGAAYLSISRERVYTGDLTGEELVYVDDDRVACDDTTPDDLILLYAPGDQVEEVFDSAHGPEIGLEITRAGYLARYEGDEDV